MHDCLRRGDVERNIEADVCVVGAGPAGITLARRLMTTPFTTCLVESGGADYEKRTQNLYAGANLGAPYYELDQARLRFFGGTLNIWGGRSCPLDEIDFEQREWVANSGWPFGRASLEPFYRRAQADLELGPYVYDERCWAELGLVPPALDPDRLRFGFWRFDMARSRFAFHRCRDLCDSRNIRLLCHANLVHIQAGPDAGRVEQLDLRSLTGNRA